MPVHTVSSLSGPHTRSCKVGWILQMSDIMSQAFSSIKLGCLQLASDTA